MYTFHMTANTLEYAFESSSVHKGIYVLRKWALSHFAKQSPARSQRGRKCFVSTWLECTQKQLYLLLNSLRILGGEPWLLIHGSELVHTVTNTNALSHRILPHPPRHISESFWHCGCETVIRPQICNRIPFIYLLASKSALVVKIVIRSNILTTLLVLHNICISIILVSATNFHSPQSF